MYTNIYHGQQCRIPIYIMGSNAETSDFWRLLKYHSQYLSQIPYRNHSHFVYTTRNVLQQKLQLLLLHVKYFKFGYYTVLSLSIFCKGEDLCTKYVGIVLYGMELGWISWCGCIVSEAPGSKLSPASRLNNPSTCSKSMPLLTLLTLFLPKGKPSDFNH